MIILSADFECSDADYSDDLLMVNCNSYLGVFVVFVLKGIKSINIIAHI